MSLACSGDVSRRRVRAFEGVDIWNAGHAHEYDVTWPIVNGTAPNKHYRDPAGPVYVRTAFLSLIFVRAFPRC